MPKENYEGVKAGLDPFPEYRKKKHYESLMQKEDRSFFDAMIAAGIQPSPNVSIAPTYSNMDLYNGPESKGSEWAKFMPSTSNLDAFTEALKSGPMSQNVETQSPEERRKAELLWKTLDHMRIARGYAPLDPRKIHPVNPPWDKIDLKGLE